MRASIQIQRTTPIGNTHVFVQILRVPRCKILIFQCKSKGYPFGNTYIFMPILKVPLVKYAYFHANPKDPPIGNTRICSQILRQILKVPTRKICLFPYKSKGYLLVNTCMFMQIPRLLPCKICVSIQIESIPL